MLHIGPFFEFQAGFFYSVYKCYKKLSEKIWGHLEVIWPPRQTPFFLAYSRKWNFSKVLETHHMIYQSTQIFMLISKMYRLIGFWWVLADLCRFEVWNGPVFPKFWKTGPFQTSKRHKSARTHQTPKKTYTFLKSARNSASIGISYKGFWTTLKISIFTGGPNFEGLRIKEDDL